MEAASLAKVVGRLVIKRKIINFLKVTLNFLTVYAWASAAGGQERTTAPLDFYT